MPVDIPHCPILRPSLAEFKNFRAFVEKTEKEYSKEYGMVKIIPPPQWKSRSDHYQQILQNLKITQPEYQSLYGNKRDYYFTCKNQKCESLTLNNFKKIAAEKEQDIKAFKNPELIQNYFWSSLTSINKEMYCANVEKTLMDSNSGEWAFHGLKSFFSEAVTESIHGLNTSFLFIGAWRTFFNWHIEDLDLSAINLLHEGAPKMWYGIHPQDRKKFESILSTLFQQQHIKCSNFMRHKQIFLNVYKLKENYPYLRISKMYQGPGEISLAFAEGYHSGFNMGFNIAEAVNYGNRDWLERYSKFKPCICPLKVGVELDHKEMVENLQKSTVYEEIKDLKAFKKIEQKMKEDLRPNQLFNEAKSQEIEMQIEKAKKLPVNRRKDKIFVPKYDRYFTAERPSFLQCDQCNAWRKVTKDVSRQYEKERIECKDLGFECKQKVRRNTQKKPKEKKIIKQQKPLTKKSRNIQTESIL